ncbi:MAG: hypothetical protein WC632_07610 [Candidatus Margulisiibacteriota bacterium]
MKITTFFFILMPIYMILGGSIMLLYFTTAVILAFSINHQFLSTEFWYLLFCIIIVWMGLKWDEAIIELYPTAIERKENTIHHNKTK